MNDIGKLRFKESGRWEILFDSWNCELTSGDFIEVKIDEYWIGTGIEYFNAYYPTTQGIKFYNGMPARRPESY